jgi:hypothetical protein
MTQFHPDPSGTPGPATGETPTEPFTPLPTEPTSTPAATTLVERPPRPGAGRWGIALGVVAVAIGVTAAAAFLLTGSAARSTVLGYTPAGTLLYTEVRMDLPGDQRQKVAEFLSAFPGFDDQSTLETKIDDVLDRIVSGASGDSHSYTGDIKPWFGGEIGLAIGELPDPSATVPDGRFLGLVTVTDAAAADVWLKDTVEDEGTTEDYKGTQLTIFDTPVPTAYAIVADKVLLVGDTASVKAAIDSGGRSDFAQGEGMTAARSAMTGDHLGFMYIDMEAYLDWTERLYDNLGGVGAMGMSLDLMRDYMPAWMAMALRAESDGLLLDAAMPHMAINPIKENRAGTVAQRLPESTIFVGAALDTDASVDAMLDLYRQMPETADVVKQVESALGLLGGVDAVTGWMGETAIAVSRTGNGVEGGIVIVPKDRTAAERLMTTLRSYATVGGAQTGIEIKVRDETYQGATITIVDLGDVEDLARLGGGMTVSPLTGHVELAYAVLDDAVVLAANAGFVRAAIDAGPGASLGENARYRALLDRVGTQNAGHYFVDLTAIRELAEQLASSSGADMAAYEREVKPYLLPFDALVITTVVGEDVDVGHMLVTVKK